MAHLVTVAQILLCCGLKQVGQIIHKGCSLEVAGKQPTHCSVQGLIVMVAPAAVTDLNTVFQLCINSSIGGRRRMMVWYIIHPPYPTKPAIGRGHLATLNTYG